MKKIILMVFLLSSGDVFAQGYWWPVRMNVQIPAIIEHTNYSAFTTTRDTGSVGFGVPDYVWGYRNRDTSYQIDDSVFMSRSIYTPQDQTIHFFFDTLNKELINFDFEFVWDLSTGDPIMYKTHANHFTQKILFSALPYEIRGESLFVLVSGKSCEMRLSQAFYSYVLADFYNPPRSQGTSSGDSYKSITLLDDTTKYRCEMIFILEKPVSTVSPKQSELRSFCNSIFLSGHTTHFSFPPSARSQSLLIYNILGREVSKIEIPAGSTSYTLSSAAYPKGTYFARLGLETASFIVN